MKQINKVSRECCQYKNGPWINQGAITFVASFDELKVCLAMKLWSINRRMSWRNEVPTCCLMFLKLPVAMDTVHNVSMCCREEWRRANRRTSRLPVSEKTEEEWTSTEPHLFFPFFFNCWCFDVVVSRLFFFFVLALDNPRSVSKMDGLSPRTTKLQSTGAK